RDRVVDLRIEPAGEHVRPCAGTTAIDEDLSSCERSGRDALPHWRRGLGDSLRAKAEPMPNPPSGGSWLYVQQRVAQRSVHSAIRSSLVFKRFREQILNRALSVVLYLA